MALRDQPYLPLYVQDIMTDEKLNECSASTHGIYIKGIMCLMHKSEFYGKILLKQKDKQTTKQSENFALKISKHTPYNPKEIQVAVEELLENGVLYLEGDFLCQKRMIADNALSEIRSNSGSKGAKAKAQANSEYENEYEIKNLSIAERMILFIEKVNIDVLTDDKDSLKAFIDYWTESNPNGKKMRFEMQKVFDIKRRFTTWVKNQKNWDKGTGSKTIKTETKDVTWP